MNKDALLTEGPPEAEFGRDPFNPHGHRRTELVGGMTRTALRDGIAKTCPRVPGVYGMRNKRGELIYIGKSKSLRSRLLGYFADSNSGEKGAKIIEGTRAIQYETQPSDFAALLREQKLIRRYSPRWNVQGVPQRQRPVYLCLGRQPAPYFFLARLPPADCIAVEGPFHGAKRMTSAVDALNKVFRLRDCSQKQVFQFAEQMQLFDMDHRAGCLRFELGNCAGPCCAACTRESYSQQVNAAQSFLDGFNDEPLASIAEQMENASANQQYELAARSRDVLDAMEYVNRKLVWLASARRDYSFIYAPPGFDGCTVWYLIRSGEVADVMAAPRSPAEYAACKPRLAIWKGWLSSRLERGHGEHPETLSVVASWFKKHKGELKKTFAPENAGRRYHRTGSSAIAG